MSGYHLILNPDLEDQVRELFGQPVAKIVAEDVADEARAIAPVGSAEDNDRHPGEYRDSIAVETRDGVPQVVSDVPHAPYVEFGVPGRGIPAQHVFYRAARQAGYQVE